jgi:hypothetical protein
MFIILHSFLSRLVDDTPHSPQRSHRDQRTLSFRQMALAMLLGVSDFNRLYSWLLGFRATNSQILDLNGQHPDTSYDYTKNAL